MMTLDFSKMNDTEMMEVDIEGDQKAKEAIFFHSADSYFKGVLVRMKVIDQRRIILKVYIR